MTPNAKNSDPQADVIAFLSSPKAHPGGAPVDVVQTHGAFIFLSGDVALKIKRAVKYDYMDLSTLELREQMIRRELALNQPTAPDIYHSVFPITHAPDGALALNGAGTPVEWVLRMRRFPASDELSVIADEGRLNNALARDLGLGVFEYHAKTPLRSADGATLITDILDELDREFAQLDQYLNSTQIGEFHAQSRAMLTRIAPLLRQRGAEGHIRRCHGDLHLRNLVMLNGKPVPFDALEFDEGLGTCDVLYDLAFLIMDLQHRTLDRAANIVLGSYLLAAMGREDDGLAALPLFLAVRAAIRAMVLAQTARATESALSKDAEPYLSEAIKALSPPKSTLVLVGGLSGSGKTTVAQNLVPHIGAAPGAVHLRSDTQRKALRQADVQSPLPASAYAPEARAAIYDQLIQRAERILKTGHSVLIDATFLTPADREKATALAARAQVSVQRFWLDAPLETLIARVTARQGDASDADANVVRAQYASPTRPTDWQVIDASGSIEQTVARLRAAVPNASVDTAIGPKS